MFRATTSRPICRGLTSVVSARLGYGLTHSKSSVTSHFHSLGTKRPQIVTSQLRPVTIPLLRYATKSGIPQFDKIDLAEEKRLAQQKLGVDPDAVTTDSSVRRVFESSQAPPVPENEVVGGLKSDLITIRDSFALNEVPRESYYLGAAGTLPYLATSIATVYLSYGINHGPAMGSSLYFPQETAYRLLAMLEPIQIGYGAVILSFLGAIHWGLEYAGYGGHRGYRRYAIGVAMPAIAWPTMLMPIEYALISQFLAFTGLYFADAQAGVRGWAPSWYPTYRFVLTFVVGVSIVVTLIGRGQVAFTESAVPTTSDRMQKLAEIQPAAQKEEERVKQKRLAASAPPTEKGAAEEGNKQKDGEDGKDAGKEKK